MLVVTFPTTSAAFAFEAACKEEEAPGCLSTIPRSLSAGCGFAWHADEDDRAALEGLIGRRGLSVEGLYEV